MDHRKEIADDDEALLTRERTVISRDGYPYINATDAGSEIVGIVIGETVDVEIYDDHVEIWPQEGADE